MMKYKLEPKRMRLVYPYVDKEPNMVLIEGLLGGNSRITVEKPLIVYKTGSIYPGNTGRYMEMEGGNYICAQRRLEIWKILPFGCCGF